MSRSHSSNVQSTVFVERPDVRCCLHHSQHRIASKRLHLPETCSFLCNQTHNFLLNCLRTQVRASGQPETLMKGGHEIVQQGGMAVDEDLADLLDTKDSARKAL